MMEIYFICTGNTCRSPMAEAILNGKQIEGITAHSAGVYAIEGMPISEHAEAIIKRFQLPYSATANQVDLKALQSADYILTMTAAHKQALIMLFPQYEGKIETLKSFVQEDMGQDVMDPYGGSLTIYEQTFDELTQLIDQLTMKIAKE